jgi:hypothetical protein
LIVLLKLIFGGIKSPEEFGDAIPEVTTRELGKSSNFILGICYKL